MKLLTAKKRKIAILFTGGLGDNISYIPLLKELKNKQFIITGIFFSKYKNDCFFDPSLIDNKIFINSNLGLLVYSLIRFRHFANIYLNHFAIGKSINIFSFFCSNRTTRTIGIHEYMHEAKRKKNVVLNFTDAEQNLHLLYSKKNAAITDIKSIYFPTPSTSIETIKKFIGNAEQPYFIIQISAGNNTTPFKNWPIKNWITLIKQLCLANPNIRFLIVGDKFESQYKSHLNAIQAINYMVLIGQTSIKDIFDLTAYCKGYIGLDSGIMHIAVALQKKTLTIIGGSDESPFNYRKLDGNNHKVIVTDMYCRPCWSWKSPNTIRVTDPKKCPDFACLTSIEPLFVFEQVVTHFNL